MIQITLGCPCFCTVSVLTQTDWSPLLCSRPRLTKGTKLGGGQGLKTKAEVFFRVI